MGSMECVTVGFDVTVSPASVPSNDGQLVNLTSAGITLLNGDQVMFVRQGQTCDTTTPFNGTFRDTRFHTNSVMWTGSASQLMSFDFAGMRRNQDVTAFLCVNSSGATSYFALPASTISVTSAVVGLSGDPHVRAANGQWLDFYGE